MKIYLINNGVSRSVDALITARIRESLDSEFTLNFTLTENDVPYINDDTLVQYGGQYFHVANYQKDREGRSPTCAVECEHVSYSLNDEAYNLEEFVYSGSAAGALSAVLSGTPLVAGTVEITKTVNISITGGTRKAILISVAAIIGGEIEYSGYTVNLRQHRGSVNYINLMGTDNVIDVSYSRDVLNGTTAYNIQLGRKTVLSCGDNVHIKFVPLDVDVLTRITAIEYNPYNTYEVEIEVGDYIPDILDNLQKTQNNADNALKTATDTANSLTDYAKKSEVSASIDTYVNSEAGRASIVQSLSGTYVETDDLNGYTKKTELSAEIGAYIDTQAGTAKIVNKLDGTFAKTDALGNYVQKTQLSTEIGSYIDTATGKAKIISAASGTYQKKSDMSGYVTTTTLNTSIAQYIDSTSGKAKIVSACSGTYAKASDLSGYAKVSAVTSIEQSVSDVEAAITLSSSYTKNTIGTNVNALLQLVSNPNSSSIKIKADMIEMSGTTKFLKASDVGSGGSTVIDGGRILSGKIKAQYIDVDELSASTVYGKGTYSSYIAFTSSGNYLFIGGDVTGSNSFSKVFIKSDYVGFGDDGNKFVIDLTNKVIRHNYSYGSYYSLGSSAKPFAALYVDEIYLDGTKLNVSASSDSSKLGDSLYYLQLNNKALTPNSSGFSLGTTTYPFDTLYVGSSTYYWKITKDSILPSSTSSSYFNIGSSTYPVQKLYAKEIYLNGTKLTTTGGSSSGATSADYSGKELKMGGSSSYYIVANTNRELRPTNSSIYSNYFYLGTASYPWHYAYIGSVATMIGTQSGSKLGFFGTTPVARQSVSNSATVATLITALKNYGLIA